VRLSVIVPTLDEASVLAATLARVRAEPVHELLVVDGGSSDGTTVIAAGLADRVLSAARGRAAQMNAGAAASTGDVLLFLHADTLLPAGFVAAIGDALRDGTVVGGRFDVRLAGASLLLPLIAAAINVRSRLSRVATGDQAMFVRRDVFDALGGFPALPLLEDVRFSAALKRVGRIARLRARVATSARRWERRGVVRTVLFMWAVRLAFALGVPPERLRRLYGDVR
jgi:rSAM/selenodomain-associated transferase 2